MLRRLRPGPRDQRRDGCASRGGEDGHRGKSVSAPSDFETRSNQADQALTSAFFVTPSPRYQPAASRWPATLQSFRDERLQLRCNMQDTRQVSQRDLSGTLEYCCSARSRRGPPLRTSQVANVHCPFHICFIRQPILDLPSKGADDDCHRAGDPRARHQGPRVLRSVVRHCPAPPHCESHC